MPRVLLMVGTKKGAYLLESDEARRDWSVRGPFCEGFEIRDVSYNPADGRFTRQPPHPGSAPRSSARPTWARRGPTRPRA